MVIFPNCKINLGLRILRKRADGFHDLETIFYPIPLTDVLEIVRREGNTQCHISGLPVSGPPESNLCLRAWHLLKKDFPSLPAVDIYLHKVLPMGAGLGGGSSDGAFQLRLLNEKFHLQLSPQTLKDYALQLGSDCPFFIDNVPSFGTGRGEALEPVKLDLSQYYITLIHPGIHVNTGWAFSQLQLNNINSYALLDIIQRPISEWKDNLVNDFEIPVFKQFPEIEAIKQQLYDSGAIYASMSGSGSTIFGLFERPTPLSINFPEHYFVRENLKL